MTENKYHPESAADLPDGLAAELDEMRATTARLNKLASRHRESAADLMTTYPARDCAGCGNEAAGNVDWHEGWRCRFCREDVGGDDLAIARPADLLMGIYQATGRHRIPELDPYAMIRPPEAAIASAMKALCPWCEDLHFRPYPEQPGNSCLHIECQCWCTQGRG